MEMGLWEVVVMALAAGAVAGWAAGAVAGSARGAAAAQAERTDSAMEWAAVTADAAERFLAEVESPELDELDVALAARVGLELETVRAAKAAVRAAVRETMVRRGAGIVGLSSAALRAAAASAAAQSSVRRVSVAAGSSAPERAAELSADLRGSHAGAGSASESPAVAGLKDRRGDVE